MRAPAGALRDACAAHEPRRRPALAWRSALAAEPRRRRPAPYVVVLRDGAERRRRRSREPRQGSVVTAGYRSALQGFAADAPTRQLGALAQPIRPCRWSFPTAVRRRRAARRSRPARPSPAASGASARRRATARAHAGDGAVAVLDTGIDLANADLTRRRHQLRHAGRVRQRRQRPRHPRRRHDRARATAASDVVGVAPGTTLYSVKVLNAERRDAVAAPVRDRLGDRATPPRSSITRREHEPRGRGHRRRQLRAATATPSTPRSAAPSPRASLSWSAPATTARDARDPRRLPRGADRHRDERRRRAARARRAPSPALQDARRTTARDILELRGHGRRRGARRSPRPAPASSRPSAAAGRRPTRARARRRRTSRAPSPLCLGAGRAGPCAGLAPADDRSRRCARGRRRRPARVPRRSAAPGDGQGFGPLVSAASY